MMRCVFRCPVTGATVEARASIRRSDGMADAVKRRTKQSVFSRLRWSVARTVRSALGYSMAGRIAGDAASSAMQGAMQGNRASFSDDEKRAAVVEAFESVSSQFVWDSAQSRWISAGAAGDVLPEFTAQLSQAPVTQPYDQGVLARMLTEVAMADGQLDTEEMQFLSQFVPPQLGSIEELAKRPPLSTAELAETSRGPARETMLMIAWGLACADKVLAEAEARKLAGLAQGLGIAEGRVQELMRYAQEFVVDQAMYSVYASGSPDPSIRQEVYQLGQQLGLDPTSVERVEIRFRKRNGLV